MTDGKKAICMFCDWRGSTEELEENDQACPECDSLHEVRIVNGY